VPPSIACLAPAVTNKAPVAVEPSIDVKAPTTSAVAFGVGSAFWLTPPKVNCCEPLIVIVLVVLDVSMKDVNSFSTFESTRVNVPPEAIVTVSIPSVENEANVLAWLVVELVAPNVMATVSAVPVDVANVATKSPAVEEAAVTLTVRAVPAILETVAAPLPVIAAVTATPVMVEPVNNEASIALHQRQRHPRLQSS